MSNLTIDLVEMAEKLDELGLDKLADSIDSINRSVTTIKTAQYLGVQGYWIRNNRCWQNCYRNKRSESPKKRAQDVWFECQEEYTQSINNDDSGWEKYAQDIQSIKKISSKHHSLFESEKLFFNRKLASNLDKNLVVRDAVTDAIKSGLNRYFQKTIDNASSLADIAVTLKESGLNELSKKARDCSAGLLKESQFWSNLKGVGNQVSNFWRGNLRGKNFGTESVSALIDGLRNTLEGYKTQKTKIDNMLGYVIQRGGPNGQIARQMLPLLKSLNVNNLAKLQQLANRVDQNIQPQAAQPQAMNTPTPQFNSVSPVSGPSAGLPQSSGVVGASAIPPQQVAKPRVARPRVRKPKVQGINSQAA